MSINAGPPWRQRALVYFAHIRELAKQTFIKPGDPAYPYAEAIARAPLALGDAIEGALGDVADRIDGASTHLDHRLDELRNVLSEVGSVAEVARGSGRGPDVASHRDRRVRGWPVIGLVCVVALALVGIGIVYGEGRAEARLVRDTSDQLAEINRALEAAKVKIEAFHQAARGDTRETLDNLSAGHRTAVSLSTEAAALARDTARSVSEMQNLSMGLRGLSNEQLAQLALIAAHARPPNQRWQGFESEQVPWPCLAAGPRHFLQKDRREVPTCIVALSMTTRVSGQALPTWVNGINTRGWENSFSQ